MVNFKYNWEEIELQYVKGFDKDGKNYFPKKKELAEMHDCDPEYLRSYARRLGWDEKRRAYLLKLEFSDGETTIEDPKAELEKFNVRCYQVASRSLSLITAEMNNKKNQNFHDISVMIKLLGQIQSIGKNSFTEMSNDFEKAQGEFTRLMKKLKEDEKAEKEPPKQLPQMEVLDL